MSLWDTELLLEKGTSFIFSIEPDHPNPDEQIFERYICIKESEHWSVTFHNRPSKRTVSTEWNIVGMKRLTTDALKTLLISEGRSFWLSCSVSKDLTKVQGMYKVLKEGEITDRDKSEKYGEIFSY